MLYENLFIFFYADIFDMDILHWLQNYITINLLENSRIKLSEIYVNYNLKLLILSQ